MSLDALETHLIACKKGNQLSQRWVYQQYYRLAMSICLRYGQNKEEAEEMCNDGFIKVFTKIENLDKAASFKAWMCRIMVNSAVDYLRKYKLDKYDTVEIEEQHDGISMNHGLENLSYEEKLQMVQKLSPVYRMVFNFYAIEGYPVNQIAEILQIAEGTVRSNLAKARSNLQKMITEKENFINNSILN